ncbi:hypothetical protein C4588_03355 [Candidatus Parcubacteria bacterium]|jgi:hypothetical protein|nr:MAG: hypothetical protein C4588_03355 [Candidatus Parcubacteria bacterium]
MTLYEIYAAGIRAYASDVIVDPEDLETVCLLSICGYQAVVKAIIANILEGCGPFVICGREEHHLSRSPLGYKVLIKKLPSGLAHGVLFSKQAIPKADDEPSFFIFTKDKEEIETLFFRHLNEKTDLPLHPSWAKWLFQVFNEDGWIKVLETLVGNYKGYRVEFKPNRLFETISEAIRTKNPQLTQCMKWKGGNGNGTNPVTKGLS